MKKIAIVGHGYVGKAMEKFFKEHYDIVTYDPPAGYETTEDEVNAKIDELKSAEPFRLLRIERDKRLTACDWVVTKHTEHGKIVPEDWKIYRQALRDLPSISYRPELNDNGQLKMDSVAWPTPPE